MCAPVRVLFLLEVRVCRRGLRTTRERWQARDVYLTRAEAVAAAECPTAGALLGWRVTEIPAAGVLAKSVLVEGL